MTDLRRKKRRNGSEVYNSHKLLDELEAKNKRLREALDTIHKRIMGYEPDNRIEARFFGELKIIARKALDSKAE